MSADSAEQLPNTAPSRLPSEPSTKAIGAPAGAAGYAAPAAVQTDCKEQDYAAIAASAGKVLDDPLLMRQLADRVCELMLEDARRQQERSRNYGRLWR